MADRRAAHAGARMGMTLAALTATLGGWLALTQQDSPMAEAPPEDARLEPIPHSIPPIEPTEVSPLRRPSPVATTRSSR